MVVCLRENSNGFSVFALRSYARQAVMGLAAAAKSEPVLSLPKQGTRLPPASTVFGRFATILR